MCYSYHAQAFTTRLLVFLYPKSLRILEEVLLDTELEESTKLLWVDWDSHRRAEDRDENWTSQSIFHREIDR